MAQLNDSSPWPGVLPDVTLTWVSSSIASITTGQLRHQKASAVVDLLADLYIRGNGTVPDSQIINALQTTQEQWDNLVYFFGSTDDLRQSVLWASNIAIPNAMHHSVQTDLLALIAVFLAFACLTSVLRIYARWKLSAGLALCDYVLVIGTALAVVVSFLFAGGKLLYSETGCFNLLKYFI
jgi:hypothetical protein